MKGRTIALDHLNGAEAAALMVDGRIEDLLIDSDHPRPGTIYRATADRVMKGSGGMFLKTPDGNAYLRGAKGLSPGESLLVQVTGYAEPGKAIPVPTRLLFKSRYGIVTPEAPGINVSRQIKDDDLRDQLLEIAHDVMSGEAGLILRSSCAEAPADAIAEDIAAMAELATKVVADSNGAPETLVEGDSPHTLAWREWTAPAEVDSGEGSFDTHAVNDAIEALRGPLVPLAASASMMIEPTRALVAVDINTGGDTSPAAGLKANLSALRDLPRQLRLRGLGGQILIDPAPTPKKDRRQIEQVLRAALRHDMTETVIAGWTQLGLIELQRKRDRVPLKDLLG